MSRLDDELRMAFRREQPSVDFSDRVLEQIARQPAPRLRWWQTLAAFFQPPKLRWVAIGVTASLLVAMGAAQYARLHPAVVDDSGKVAVVPNAGVPGNASRDTGAIKIPDSTNQAPAPKREPKPHSNIDRNVVATSSQKPQNTRPRNRVVNPEAEAAKEKVMLALHIASSTLNDAQRAIREDDNRPQR